MTTPHTTHTCTARRGVRARMRRIRPGRVIPPETRAHLRNAGREQLLAVRSILDKAIDRLDGSGSKQP